MSVTRNDSQKPWWAEGLPFECQKSGACCHRRGDIGYVYVNYQERKVLADLLGMTVPVFTRQYTVSEDDGSRVLKFREERCIFLEDATCRVHQAKPVQCRTWPFWKETLMSKEAYQRDVLDFCPGSRHGEIVPADEIGRQMDETERALWEV